MFACHDEPVSLVFLLMGIAVIGGAVLLATGRFSGSLPDPAPDRVLEGLGDVPLGDLTPEQVDEVRIDQAVRGYRMDEVDALVDRLAAEIAARDDIIAMRDAEIESMRPPHGA